MFQQELHGGDVAARARERQRVVRLRRAPGTARGAARSGFWPARRLEDAAPDAAPG